MGVSQATGLSKFAWTCLVLQVVIGGAYVLLVRYHPSADAKHVENQKGEEHELKENLEKYPMIIDIHMMLIGGFGFLMTFLRRFGFSALGLTMIVTAFATEWTILINGFKHIDHETWTIQLTMLEVLEGGFAAAAVLISLGGLLGKVNPFQLLVVVIIEASLFVVNGWIGYTVLGVADVGGAMFIHTFGAYFGLACSLMFRGKDVGASERYEESRYTSDIFSMIGTVILWIYWPSFNAVLASGDGFHRAVINTYISLLASTLATFIVSSLMGDRKRFEIVDIQNATLSGGVAVGAIADLMLQPYGAFLMGSLCGVVSTLGYRALQGKLFDKLKLHDTCGINNLHGMPGVISGIAAVVMAAIATEDVYGPSLYTFFPRCAPVEGSDELAELQGQLDSVEAGEGRTLGTQALYQLVALLVTLAMALIGGAVTGLIINVEGIFDPLREHQFFNDEFFWALPTDAKSLGSKKGSMQVIGEVKAKKLLEIPQLATLEAQDGRGSFSKVAPTEEQP